MSLQKVLSDIVSGFVKAVKGEAATKGAAVEAEATRVLGNKSTASKLAAGLKPYLIVSAADAILGKIPVVNEIVSRIQQVKDTILDKTIGQIPLMGKPWMEGNRLAMQMLMPNARKYVKESSPESLFNAINDSASQVFNWFKPKNNGNNEQAHINAPRFYEALDMHTEFRIPMCYPDDVGVPFAGSKNFASIEVIDLQFNPVTSYTKEKARYTQMLDLLKGVRGLSGQLPYSEADLFFYDWNTKYLITEYFRLKYALKLSRVYSLTKTVLPKYLLSQLGFDADDFINNKAQYIAKLTDMHNYIKNSVPCFGLFNERIESILFKLIPDSNDPKVALYYCVNLCIETLVPDDASGEYLHYKPMFELETTNVKSTDPQYGLDVFTNLAITYAQYTANFDAFTSNFPYCHKSYSSVKGDLIGAFGTSVIWSDKTIKEVETCTADSMYHKFDELFLTQLQNATILDRKGSDLRNSGTVVEATVAQFWISGITVPTITNGVISDMLKPASSARDYVQVVSEIHASNPEGTAGTIMMPQTDGARAISTLGDVLTDETAILANKYKMSEGEQLEVTQLISWYQGSGATYDQNSNLDKLFEIYQTQTLFVTRVRSLYKDISTGANTSYRLRPVMFIASTGAIFNFNVASEIATTAQLWSQADYGMKLPICAYYSGVNRDAMLWDFNIMGSISKSAFAISVKYSTYSQYSANIKAGENTGRRVNNIVDAYKVSK